MSFGNGDKSGNPPAREVDDGDQNAPRFGDKEMSKIRDSLTDKLDKSGKRAQLRQLLKKRLIESGWDEEMTDYCKAIMGSKILKNFDVEKFVEEIAQNSRVEVPDPIRSEIYGQIKTFLELAGTKAINED